MSYEEWKKKYKPIQNAVVDDAPFEGIMYDTTGNQNDLIQDTNHKQVWTIIEEEGLPLVIVPGYVIPNRLGNIVTEEKWEASLFEDFEVIIN